MRNFQRSDKVFLAFGEDLRRTLEEAEFVQRDGRRSVRLRGRSPLLRELTEKAHQKILELIVRTLLFLIKYLTFSLL